jgi:hypothetical protein
MKCSGNSGFVPVERTLLFTHGFDVSAPDDAAVKPHPPPKIFELTGQTA